MWSESATRRLFCSIQPYLNIIPGANSPLSVSSAAEWRFHRMPHNAPRRLQVVKLSCLSAPSGRRTECRVRLLGYYNGFGEQHARRIHATNVQFNRVKAREVMAKLDTLLDEENKTKQQKKEKSKIGKKGMVTIWANMSVSELAKVLKVDVDKVFEFMLYVKGAEHYDRPTAKIRHVRIIEEICKIGGYRWQVIKSPALTAVELIGNQDDVKFTLKPRSPAPASQLRPRPPVVCIMGHVDHGKTTLLDALRDTRVVDQEFGGITQHIGAFSVTLPTADKQEESVTFLDTPGHAAFAAMRSRGAHVTDIVVLVVAADDGVMEQTRESLKYAREAGAVLIVALNKCDKPTADIPAAKKGLWTENVQLEDFGGDVQCVAVSALKRQGLTELIEAIVAQAEVMQLRADPTGPVEGIVIESRHDPTRGGLATIIVQRGTLKKGDCLVAGFAHAKVRAMFDTTGGAMTEVSPGMPAEVLGWRAVPNAGDELYEVEDESFARQVVEYRERKRMEEKTEKDQVEIDKSRRDHLAQYKKQLEARKLLGSNFKRMLKPITVVTDAKQRADLRLADANKKPRVSLVIKGDVQGSVEAILDVLGTFNSTKCDLQVVHYGVGVISENDIHLADTFRALIYSFNVPVNERTLHQAQQLKLHVKRFNIIYRLVEDLKNELSAVLPPNRVEVVAGEAQVLQHFYVSVDGSKKKRPVAGCRCTKGVLTKQEDHAFRVVRSDGQIVYEGKLLSMKHFKNEVNEVTKDQECGLMFAVDPAGEPIEFKLGDTVVCYTIASVPDKIDWSPPGF